MKRSDYSCLCMFRASWHDGVLCVIGFCQWWNWTGLLCVWLFAAARAGLAKRRAPSWFCSTWPPSVASIRGLSSRYSKPIRSSKVCSVCFRSSPPPPPSSPSSILQIRCKKQKGWGANVCLLHTSLFNQHYLFMINISNCLLTSYSIFFSILFGAFYHCIPHCSINIIYSWLKIFICFLTS